MRKGFPGLSALVREQLGHEPRGGDVFVFVNQRGDRLKALWFDGTGYALLYKQLDHGTFRLPLPRGCEEVEMTSGELALLLEGADLRVRPRRPTHPPLEKVRFDREKLRFDLDVSASA